MKKRKSDEDSLVKTHPLLAQKQEELQQVTQGSGWRVRGLSPLLWVVPRLCRPGQVSYPNRRSQTIAYKGVGQIHMDCVARSN
jgi:hypothetical protein